MYTYNLYMRMRFEYFPKNMYGILKNFKNLLCFWMLFQQVLGQGLDIDRWTYNLPDS